MLINNDIVIYRVFLIILLMSKQSTYYDTDFYRNSWEWIFLLFIMLQLIKESEFNSTEIHNMSNVVWYITEKTTF